MMTTLDQKVAEAASQNVQALLDQKSSEVCKKYRSLVRGVGSHLRNSGLMATLAFLASRDEVPANSLLEHLISSLPQAGARLPPTITNSLSLLNHVAAASISEYMILTRATLLVLSWHRRMADVLIETSTTTAQREATQEEEAL